MTDTDARDLLADAVLALAANYDGAVSDDGAGFNGFDASFGHTIAERITDGIELTHRQRDATWRMLAKYRAQLAAHGIDYDAIPQPAGPAVAQPTRSHDRDTTVIWITEQGRIAVASPFKYKDLCKTIPAYRWDRRLAVPGTKRTGAWTYPLTPTSAAAVIDAFRSVRCAVQPQIRELAERHRAAQEVTDTVKAAADDDLPEVPGEHTESWPHQRRAFHAAADREAFMLGMDMGTGKSKVLVDLARHWQSRTVLIICPLSVLGVWPREFRRHAPDLAHVYAPEQGSIADKTRGADEHLACRCGRTHVVVVNYDVLPERWPFTAWARSQDWDLVACDESHRIKASQGVWSKAAWKIGKGAKRRICLTGTPLAHSPLDAFAQYRFLDQSIFGTSYISFQARYAIMGGYEGREVLGMNPETEPELTRKIHSIGFFVDADDVQDLPPVSEVTRECTLEPKARKAYDAIDAQMYADLSEFVEARRRGDSEVTAPNVLVQLLRKQQVTGGSVNDDAGEPVVVSTAKAKLLEDVMRDLAHPTVVFCRFVHDLDVVRGVGEKLGWTVGELSGRANSLLTTDATMRDDVDLGVVQIQSGGVGIDLTRARYAVYYSLGYSLTDYLQSRKRIHRPGQKHPTTFLHLVCENTEDVEVYEALAARKKVVDHVLGKRVMEVADDDPTRANALADALKIAFG